MITTGRVVMWERTFGPGDLGLGKAVSSEHAQVASAELASQLPQFLAQTVADFFAGEDEASKIFAMGALLGRLMKQMVDKGGHADEDLGLKFAQVANGRLGAQNFAAT